MATTQNEHSGNGTLRRFSFTFPYIKEDDVKVSVRTNNANVTTLDSDDYTFPTATEIQLNAVAETDFQESTGAPKTGVTLRVFRETDINNPKAVFYPGSSIRAQDLNDNTLQALYAEQEREDRAVDRIGGGEQSTMQANLVMQQSDIVFQGQNIPPDDTNEITLTVAEPTADRTITLPNVTGTVVTTGDLGTVTRAMLADDAVNGGKLADDSVDSQHYVAGSIDLEHMSANSVDSDQYVDGSIDRVHLAPDVIDGSKLADNSVDSEHYVNGSIDREHLAADIVDGTKIDDNAIDSEHYVDGSIDREHLAADIIDGTKIDDNVINSEHYVDGSIDNQHIADHTIQYGKLQEISTDHRLLGRDSSTDADVAEVQVATDMIADDQVTYAKMQDITSDHRLLGRDNANDGTVSEVQVATDMVVDDAITDAKLADSTDTDADRAVGTNHIKNSAVTSAKIADGTIVNDDINANAAIAGSKISMQIGELSNVTLTNLSDNQILKFDSASGVWQNEADGGSGGSSSTDLSQVRTDTTVQVVSSTGNNVTIPAADADDSNSEGAGIMSKDQATRVARTILDAAPALHANLSVGGNEITSTSDGNIVINPDGNGTIELGAATTVSTGNVTLDAGGVSTTGGASVFNEGGDDFDFRIEGTGQTHLLFVDANNDRVAINTSTTHAGTALTVAGDVGLGNGNTLNLMASANNNTVDLGHGGSAISYRLNFPNALPTDANRFLRATGNTSPITLEFAEVDTSSSDTTGRIEHSNTTDGFTVAADSNAAMVGPLTVNENESILIGPGGNGSNANSVFKIL